MGYPRFLPAAIALPFLILSPPAALAADAANGNTAYHTFCVSCHGDPPRGGPETAAGNPQKIRNALNTVGAMQFLRGQVTDTQIQDIAEYIASLSAPPPPVGPFTPLFDYSDLWWNPAESGWGVNIVQHTPSNNIFGVIYTYDTPKRPMWFVIPGGTWTSSTTFTGVMCSVTGFPGNVPWPSNSSGLKVDCGIGNATFLFSDQSHAHMTYSVNGVQVTKTIERQPF